MRFSKLIAQTVRMVSREEAESYVGGPQMLGFMEKAEWIRPAVKRQRTTLFDVKLLDQACDRLSKGEFPDSPENPTS